LSQDLNVSVASPVAEVKAITTFYRWGTKGPVGSLVEGNCLKAGMLAALIEDEDAPIHASL
jgi:hypothetical protein